MFLLHQIRQDLLLTSWNTAPHHDGTSTVLQMALDTHCCTSLLTFSLHIDNNFKQKCQILIYLSRRHERLLCSGPSTETISLPLMMPTSVQLHSRSLQDLFLSLKNVTFRHCSSKSSFWPVTSNFIHHVLSFLNFFYFYRHTAQHAAIGQAFSWHLFLEITWWCKNIILFLSNCYVWCFSYIWLKERKQIVCLSTASTTKYFLLALCSLSGLPQWIISLYLNPSSSATPTLCMSSFTT